MGGGRLLVNEPSFEKLCGAYDLNKRELDQIVLITVIWLHRHTVCSEILAGEHFRQNFGPHHNHSLGIIFLFQNSHQN